MLVVDCKSEVFHHLAHHESRRGGAGSGQEGHVGAGVAGLLDERFGCFQIGRIVVDLVTRCADAAPARPTEHERAALPEEGGVARRRKQSVVLRECDHDRTADPGVTHRPLHVVGPCANSDRSTVVGENEQVGVRFESFFLIAGNCTDPVDSSRLEGCYTGRYLRNHDRFQHVGVGEPGAGKERGRPRW